MNKDFKMKGAIPWIMLTLLITLILVMFAFSVLYPMIKSTAETAKTAGSGLVGELSGIVGAFFYI